MASSEPQGWYEDPFRLHEARYFSAGKPTKLVRDGNIESCDEPPAAGVPGSGAVASSGHAVSATLTRAEAATANSLDRIGENVPPYARSRPRGLFTAVAVIAVAGIVTAVAVVAGKPRPATQPDTEAVAYTATMNASSADVFTSYTLADSSHKLDLTITQSGPVSWAAGQGDLTVKVGKLGWNSREIIDGRKAYSKFSAKDLPAGTVAANPGLAGWTETTWTGTPSQDMSGILPSLFIGALSYQAGMASPASLLGLLKAQASSVQNLGGEVLGGVNTTHYRAFIPLSRLGATTAEEVAQMQKDLGANFLGVDYWTDSAHLLRQLRLVITVREPPSDATTSPGEVSIGTYPITTSITLGLSHYGVPVHVVPPPPAQITSRVTCAYTQDGFNCPSS